MQGHAPIHVRKLFQRSCDNVGSESAEGSPWNCSHRASSIDIGWANFEHYLCTSFQCSSRLAFCIVKKSVSMTSVELRYSVAQRAIKRFAKHFASEAVIHGLRCEARRSQCNNWISRQTVAKGVTSNSGGDSKIVWLVLPGHPALRGFREIERALSSLQMDSLWSSAWKSAWHGPAPVIIISWKKLLASFSFNLSVYWR